jgi:antitoxin YefM
VEKISYSYARQHLRSILDQVVGSSEVFCIERKNKGKVVMIEEDDYTSLIETSYLLRSQNNARELFKALKEAKENIGVNIEL